MSLPETDQRTSPINKPLLISGAVLGVLGYGFFAYGVDRTESITMLSVYALLFAVYFFFIRQSRNATAFQWLFGFAIFFRAIFLFSEPLLSDDVYRFLWDGQLSAQGINPFTFTPLEIMNGFAAVNFEPPLELYALVNSPNYHTIYPPICQAIFAAAALLFPNSILPGIVLIRLSIFAAEIRTLFLLKRLLELHEKPLSLLFLYALNPLIIIELTGNLHFEALMIMFLLEALVRWKEGRLNQCALFMGLAISTKLLPLIFLPLFLRRLSIKQMFPFYGIVGIVMIICFSPLLSSAFVSGFSESFSLYFQKFEFNASVYYIAREIGFQVKGYNMIAFSGKLMAALTFISIMLYALVRGKKSNPIETDFLWVWFLYLVFALTVHPWYITPLIAFLVFTNFRFPILWSALVIVTYMGYTADGYNEPIWLIGFEYVAVFLMLAVEIIWQWRKRNTNRQLSE